MKSTRAITFSHHAGRKFEDRRFGCLISIYALGALRIVNTAIDSHGFDPAITCKPSFEDLK